MGTEQHSKSNLCNFFIILCLVTGSYNASAATIRATIHTSAGQIPIELFADHAPITVTNFLNLSQRGFYDELPFYREQPGILVLVGNPSRQKNGGPGYRIADEIHPKLAHDRPGILSMDSFGPGGGGSQFVITRKRTRWRDGRFTIFGRVTSPAGLQIVNDLTKSDYITRIEIQDEYLKLFALHTELLSKWNAILDKKLAKRQAFKEILRKLR